MRIAKKLAHGLISVLALAAALQLIAPKAARAVVSTFVTVVNSPANPVTTLSSSQAPSQLMELYTEAGEGQTTPFAAVDPSQGINQAGTGSFVVPPTQAFVVTQLEMTITGSSSSIPRQVVLVSGSLAVVKDFWTVSGGQTIQLAFPSGIVFPSGSAPALVNYDAFPGNIIAVIHGYLAPA